MEPIYPSAPVTKTRNPSTKRSLIKRASAAVYYARPTAWTTLKRYYNRPALMRNRDASRCEKPGRKCASARRSRDKIYESRSFLRRPRNTPAGLFHRYTKTAGAARLSPDTLACNEVLRLLRTHRFRSMPGPQGRYD